MLAGRGRSTELINQHELEGTEGNLKADIRSFSNSKEWKIQSFKREGGDILNWAKTESAQKKTKNVFCCFSESVQTRDVKQAVRGLSWPSYISLSVEQYLP
jgi:hypothetical protein